MYFLSPHSTALLERSCLGGVAFNIANYARLPSRHNAKGVATTLRISALESI